ncbi:MAG TPA: MBL fold metallo-hydrolase [Chitinivibrionales bacterium]|nr:MBL fold metallo-hydrolase [Chitinivibrionales bacterium]
MNLTITKFVTGPLETNTYVVSLKQEPVLVIDPSSNCQELLAFLKSKKLSVEAILLTHGHFDHLLGISEIQAYSPDAAVWVHPKEKFLLVSAEYNGSFMVGMNYTYKGKTSDLNEGNVTIGAFAFEVLFMPGHSPGGVALVFREGKQTACFSGDSLFADSIGRYDFPGSDGQLLVKNIKEKLLALPDDTVVYPGHMGRTTIGRERRMNPFLTELNS